MLSYHHEPRVRVGSKKIKRPQVLAVFSYRYDAHLVPDLIQNIRGTVDGWISWDDRHSPEYVSSDLQLRYRLLDAAFEVGADWVLRVDPDERFEGALAGRMDEFTAKKLPIAWHFDLRELYTADTYRIDGIWGQKRQGRLVPLFGAFLPAARGWYSRKEYHGASFPRFFIKCQTHLNLYHLKMIEPARRAHRRDLYHRLDPNNQYQHCGYNYLADEAGAVFERIEPGRGYQPAHQDDGQLWMAPIQGDPA